MIIDYGLHPFNQEVEAGTISPPMSPVDQYVPIEMPSVCPFYQSQTLDLTKQPFDDQTPSLKKQRFYEQTTSPAKPLFDDRTSSLSESSDDESSNSAKRPLDDESNSTADSSPFKKQKTHQDLSIIDGACKQYEGVRSSVIDYEKHLYNPYWDHDVVFSGTNEQYMLQCSSQFTEGIDFDKPTGDLDNDIVPLFARENWLLDGFVENPDLLWDRIQPALRLASLFLTVPQVAWAFLPLIAGTPTKWEGEGDLLSYSDYQMLEEHVKDPTFLPSQFERIRQRFADLTGKVKFTFATFGKINRWTLADQETEFIIPDEYDWLAEREGQVHGLTFAPGEPYLSDIFVRGNPDELKACQNLQRTFIHGGYAEFFQKESHTQPVQLIRSICSLAVSLVHEMAHAFYCLEKHPDICNMGQYREYDEPHVFTDMDCAEIGSAIERRLFGYVWQTIMHPEEGASMDVVTNPCVWHQGEVVQGRSHHVHYVEPIWCYNLLKKSRWEEIKRIPLENSMACCHWPSSFRAHARVKKPNILNWWTRRAKGEDLSKMKQFDKDPVGGWEFVIRIAHQDEDGSWNMPYDDQEWYDAVLAMETLDREFLEWRVREFLKEREMECD